MRRRLTLLAFTAVAMVALIGAALMVPSAALAGGATQISGIGFPTVVGECSDPQGQSSDFAVRMTGDLVGCLYTYVETAECSPSGTYHETGRETFVGLYNGEAGSFRTTYRFTAKYQDCPHLTEEIIGRCEHPITAGSGEGVFAGVSGRLDFKDEIEAGNFPYRGHLRY
jgi:hypothetical protein